MPRAPGDTLLNAALDDLRRMGYQTSWPPDSSLGRNVRRFRKDADDFTALVQGRTFVTSGYRYTIGIVIPDLRHVDRFIPWFENERVTYIIPANWLCGILDQCIERNEIAYSTGNRQWRVDFHIDENNLSPQQSGGDRYSIKDYRFEIPPKNEK